MTTKSTARRYFLEWEYFARWCRKNGYPILPSTPKAVAEYLSLFPSYSACAAASAAITYAHRLAHLRSPVRHPLVFAAKRNLALKEGLKWPPVRYKPTHRTPRAPLSAPLSQPAPDFTPQQGPFDPWTPQ